MKYIPRMLSIFGMMIMKWVVISSYAEPARKLVPLLLSLRGNCYSLAEQARNLLLIG
jgi:hypothetical protein